jgi:hypothetical protein
MPLGLKPHLWRGEIAAAEAAAPLTEVRGFHGSSGAFTVVQGSYGLRGLAQ